MTKKCNLRCIYCYAGSKYTKNFIFTRRDYTFLLKIARELGENGVQKVIVSGGEPTLIPKLPNLIKILNHYDVYTFLATNGTLINESYALKLKEVGLDQIQAKLDAGKPQIQDRLSGIEGSYFKMIKGIKSLKKVGFKVEVNAVITSLNIRDISYLINKCIALKVDKLKLATYIPGCYAINGRGGEYLYPQEKDISELLSFLEERKIEFEKKIDIREYQHLSKRDPERMPICNAMITTMCILPDGKVSVCEMLSDYLDKNIIGDLKNKTLNEVWNSKKAEEWIHRDQNHFDEFSEECKSCSIFRICKGGCPWRSLIAYGKPFYCDPTCKRAPKETLIRLFLS